jgi:SPP1 gp7 family putative phage head morphogenesis protein
MIPRDNAIQSKMGDLVASHLAAANLLGRTHIAETVQRKTGKVIPIATSSRFRRLFSDSNDGDSGDPDVYGNLSLPYDLSTKLPPTDAVNYLRNLTPVTKETFDGLSAQYRKDAFTVAGTTDLRLIAKVRDELAGVIEKGGTEADFEKAVTQMETEAGVEEINAFALDTVFTTNMQKAYSLGRYEQMMDPAVLQALPYWQYLTVEDDRVRPEHAVIDKFTARAGDADPVWRKIYPPNGFNCRCIVIPLLREEAGKDADEPGLARLPVLAMLLVPQEGFSKVFAECCAA